MRRAVPDTDRILAGVKGLAVKSDASQAADGGQMSFGPIASAIVLNYTGALVERQLKRSLRTLASCDCPDLLFKGPFTIIRSFEWLCWKECD